ncbi:MAG: hypothetical protein II072_05595 [Clostridia bacterium]|nr:hypothetical protein [Clostridia bacterium]
MFHWIEDKAFAGKMKSTCSDLVNQLVQAINKDGALSVRQHLVGSGAKNLITQNANQPVDLDYNLEIVESRTYSINDCGGIKEYIRGKFDEVLDRTVWGNCEDSTSALTTKKRCIVEGNPTKVSIDLCIVRKGAFGSWYRLIHQKTGNAWTDRYYWNEARQSSGLEERIRWLKGNDCWLEVREAYLEKKNMYLSRGDHNHPSFICYIEAVNEVFYKYANAR